MTYKDVVKEVMTRRGGIYDLDGDSHSNFNKWYDDLGSIDLMPQKDDRLRIWAICQLMMIADYYNSKRNEKNDGWEICWNTRRQKYELVSWGECRYGGVRFFCKKDAEEVMNNPEFDKILSSVLKHS